MSILDRANLFYYKLFKPNEIDKCFHCGKELIPLKGFDNYLYVCEHSDSDYCLQYSKRIYSAARFKINDFNKTTRRIELMFKDLFLDTLIKESGTETAVWLISDDGSWPYVGKFSYPIDFQKSNSSEIYHKFKKPINLV